MRMAGILLFVVGVLGAAPVEQERRWPAVVTIEKAAMSSGVVRRVPGLRMEGEGTARVGRGYRLFTDPLDNYSLVRFADVPKGQRPRVEDSRVVGRSPLEAVHIALNGEGGVLVSPYSTYTIWNGEHMYMMKCACEGSTKRGDDACQFEEAASEDGQEPSFDCVGATCCRVEVLVMTAGGIVVHW